MNKKLRKESAFFYIGWFFIFALLPFGNTSVGSIFIILDNIYNAIKYRESSIDLKAPTILPFFIFIGWMFICNIWAVKKGIAFLSSLAFALMIYAIFIGSSRLVKQKEYLFKWLLPVFSISGLISSLYTISTYVLGGRRRARALFTATNGAGTLLIITLLFTIGMFLSSKKKTRFFFLIPTISMTLALLFTFSRGAWIGTFIALIFLFLLHKKGLLPVAIVLPLAGSIIHFEPAFKDRFYKIFSLKANNDRIYIWRTTLHMIKANLLKGVGTGMFPFEYLNYTPDEDATSIAFAHNMILQIAAEFGIPGLLLFLYILFSILQHAFYKIKERNPLYQTLVAAFLGVLTHQMVDCTIYGLEIGGAFWLLAGLIINLSRENETYSSL